MQELRLQMRVSAARCFRAAFAYVNILGSVSSDGRYLSFADWETGDLAVRDLEAGKNRRLTNKGTWWDSSEYAEFPAVSPDGKQVAYAWSNKDGFFDLRLIPLDGSKPLVLYSNKEMEYVQPAGWSPDGKHILATFRASKLVLRTGFFGQRTTPSFPPLD